MEFIIKRKGQSHEVLIDDADWPLISQYKWNICKNYNTFYVRSHPNTYLHRLILDAPPGIKVDHKNRNGLDCRRKNIRLITNSGNGRNRVCSSSTGIMGAYSRRNKFQSCITIKGKVIHLGMFDTAEEAGDAYQKAKTKQFPKELL